jgi:hypothetical protein
MGAGMAGLWLLAVTVASLFVIWSIRAPIAVFFDSTVWPRILAILVTGILFLPAGFFGLWVVRSRALVEE